MNLTSAATWRAPIDELIPVGPFSVRVRLPKEVRGAKVQYLVGGGGGAASVAKGWASFKIASIADHEVVVIA